MSRNNGTRNAFTMPMKWPTGVPVIWGGPPTGYIQSSWCVSHRIVRCECTTPFGSRVVPEVNAMIAGDAGSTAAWSVSGSVSSVAANGSAAGGRADVGDSPTTSQRVPSPGLTSSPYVWR